MGQPAKFHQLVPHAVAMLMIFFTTLKLCDYYPEATDLEGLSPLIVIYRYVPLQKTLI